MAVLVLAVNLAAFLVLAVDLYSSEDIGLEAASTMMAAVFGPYFAASNDLSLSPCDVFLCCTYYMTCDSAVKSCSDA